MNRDEVKKHIVTMLPFNLSEEIRKSVAEQVVDIFIADYKNTVELCARTAEHQAEICGRSMSRQSTSHDIAFNIRKLLDERTFK
jgi:hypothetical protein